MKQPHQDFSFNIEKEQTPAKPRRSVTEHIGYGIAIVVLSLAIAAVVAIVLGLLVHAAMWAWTL